MTVSNRDSDMPRRIQRRRAKGYRVADACTNPNGYVDVTRPGPLGNPWRVVPEYPEPPRRGEKLWRLDGPPGPLEARSWFTTPECARRAAADAFDEFIDARQRGVEWALAVDYPTDDEIRARAAGKDIVCYCAPSARCHGDTILTIAASLPDDPYAPTT